MQQICNVVALCFNGLQVSQGFGKHVINLSPQQQIDVRKYNFALEFPILFGNTLSQISINLLLLRILDLAATPVRRYFLHELNVSVVGYTLLDIFNNVFACSLTAKIWDLERPGTCRTIDSIIDMTYTQGGEHMPIK